MTTPKESILLVDDEEAIRGILNKGLAMRGYTCDEAGDGEEALARLRQKPAELVIMDINMPGRQGDEVIPDIITNFPETAVIMASGVSDTRTIARCIKNGAQDYINKPFKFEQILQSISGTLDKRRVVLEIQRYLQAMGKKDGREGPRKLFLGPVESLVNAMESLDMYIKGHTQQVSELSLSIGQRMGFSAEDMDDLRWAALLHDVGKIAVDPNILNKPGELTSSEYRHIMMHAIVGPSLVKPFVNDKVVDIISHHHDRYDGSGLDQKIRGRDIPLGARIIAVADAFQAMTSDRPYRRAMSRHDAMEELVWYSGTQFDPIVANVLISRFKQQAVPQADFKIGS
jgi:putative nucleotidyltransferase with HDIG domain